MAFQLGDNQKALLTAGGTDAAGNPATAPTGGLTWSGSDGGTVLTLTPSADTLTCEAIAVGPLGTSAVTVTDGTLSSPAFDIDVVATAAVALSITAGTPESK